MTAFHKELTFLKDYFSNNGYPHQVIYGEINKFLRDKMNPRKIIQTAEQRKIYMVIPYFGKHTENLRDEMSKIVGKYFPQINLQIITVNQNTIGSYFNFKDSLPDSRRSNVVYKYSCELCPFTSYVGSTTRPLYMRIAEHRGRSYRTGRLLQTPPNSSIRDHCKSLPNHFPKEVNFKVVGAAKNAVTLRILESLHIIKDKPQLNNQKSSFPLQIVA